MQDRTGYYISAASTVVLAVAVWLVYFYQHNLPIIDYLVNPHFRPFLLSFGPIAAYGVLLAVLASERVTSPAARIPAGIIAVLVAAYFLWAAVQAVGGAGSGINLAVVLLPGLAVALTAWILLMGVGGVLWRKIWLYIVALALVVIPPLIFSVRFGAAQYPLGDKYFTLALALIPAILFLLAALIFMGNKPPMIVVAAVFGLLALTRIAALVRMLNSWDYELASVTLAAIALLAGAWLNYRTWRTVEPLEE